VIKDMKKGLITSLSGAQFIKEKNEGISFVRAPTDKVHPRVGKIRPKNTTVDYLRYI
jgi:hypothetical protein